MQEENMLLVYQVFDDEPEANNNEPFGRLEVDVPPKGYFYDPNGEFVDYQEGSEDVYVVENNAYRKLDITHSDFCYIAGVIKAEDSMTFIGAAATTQATFNAVKVIKNQPEMAMKDQSGWAKKLLETNYSSVPSKQSLQDSSDDIQSKNARKGLIHVLQGGHDHSLEAVRWDGIDFADTGTEHSKAKKEGISISRTLWTNFIDTCQYKPDSDGIMRLNRGPADRRKTKEEAFALIPFLVGKEYGPFPQSGDPAQERLSQLKNEQFETQEIQNLYPNTYSVTNELYECTGSGNNTGRVLNKALIVSGGHIFWGMNKHHRANNGYLWRYFLGTTI
jgi:hypothetical protein